MKRYDIEVRDLLGVWGTGYDCFGKRLYNLHADEVTPAVKHIPIGYAVRVMETFIGKEGVTRREVTRFEPGYKRATSVNNRALP